MSAHYKVACLCEALLVSRSGYYAWKARRSQPGPREVENIGLRERIRAFPSRKRLKRVPLPQRNRLFSMKSERSPARKEQDSGSR